MTETSCVNSTICSIQTVVVSTVGTTNDPVTITNSLGDTATGTPKEASSKFWPGSFYTTITMTICSENDQCEEVVSVIPPNETMYISTSTKFEKKEQISAVEIQTFPQLPNKVFICLRIGSKMVL